MNLEELNQYLEQHENKELLRFVAVGSVDDGKSTLIGRFLHDTHGIYEDQLAAVKKATSSGSTGEEIDFSLFTDGLKAEREQGITIDVAYRYFSTEKRKFIIADTPGHVQYTRNMATGASTANVAIILIDARHGVLAQSRRHAYIASLLGIPHLMVAVNKMDLKDYARDVFDDIVSEFRAFCKGLNFKDVGFVPISAKLGDNVVSRSAKTSWYQGSTILEYLEKVPVSADLNLVDFRLPIQTVLRPDLNYRAFAGQIASGVLKKGDRVKVLPSLRESTVAGIDIFGGELEEAFAPQSVAVRLSDEIDISRGDMLVHCDNVPHIARRFDAHVVWMNEQALDPAKSYILKHTTQSVRVDIEKVTSITEMKDLSERSAETLELNDIGQLRLSCHRPIYFDAYQKNRGTGAFILIDSVSNATVASGMIIGAAISHSELPTAPGTEILRGTKTKQSQVSLAERSKLLKQQGATIWLTGLPAAGKSDIAYALERYLFDRGFISTVVDPDDGLAESAVDLRSRSKDIPERLVEVARRLNGAGIISIFAFASPSRSERDLVSKRIGGHFFEVHVSTSEETARTRDRRGVYAEVAEFSYDSPISPAIRVSLDSGSADSAAQKIAAVLEDAGIFARKG